MTYEHGTPTVDPATVAEIDHTCYPVLTALIDGFAALFLHAAANGVAARGWRNGPSESPTGPLCVLDALKVAAFGRVGDWAPADSDVYRAYVRAHDHLHDHLGGRVAVSDWNDRGCRDGDHAVEVLRDAAASLAAGIPAVTR